MQAPLMSLKSIVVGGLAFVAAALIAGAAIAGGCGCTPPTPPASPPSCCAPPSAPPAPPSQPCCQPPGHTVNIPGVNVYVSSSIVVNAVTQASASASAQGGVNGSGTVVIGGGGGGGGYAYPGAQGMIQGLGIDSGGQTQKTAYESTRSVTKKVVIQAVCIDDKDVPHPASQVTPDRDIDDAYDNELYRCIAGTHMQATIAEYNGEIAFEHGQTLACAKGDALYHSPGGHVECRPQKPARDCNERSLLRRFGAGVKILTMITTEKYTAYREETTQSSSGSATAMSLDGGVGGITF